VIRNLHALSFATVLTALATCLCFPNPAAAADSGQRTFGKATVEPAFDDSTGGIVYLLTPHKAPLPSKANTIATAPLYLVVYPLSSTIVASDLNCQPSNCDHINVLPFPDADYLALPGTDPRCVAFNGGNPCSAVKGHDHLVGIASTKGDFNVAWHVQLVIFTGAAVLDGKINTRVTTLAQITALVASGDAFIADTPITFNCSSTSERTYDIGTPITIPFP
jgi:hypothetical protein